MSAVDQLAERWLEEHRIVGTSSALAQALELAAQAARSEAPVLLEGETGTGKEAFARLIHACSARAAGPLLAVNCAALPEGLLASELFGYVRGAFTGADHDRAGLFQAASGGTLVLDEAGEMSQPVQAILLRVLEDRQVRPVGCPRSRSADVRVIAATNRELGAAVREGRFRADLYYRLRVFPIRVPPLRERREDVRSLALHFLARYAKQEGRRLPGFDPETLRVLEAYEWPGNVRELQHEVHRLVLVAVEDELIGPELLALGIRTQAAYASMDHERPLRDILRDVELATVQERLARYGYHRTATARSLGITREALWAKLRQLRMAVPRRSEGKS